MYLKPTGLPPLYFIWLRPENLAAGKERRELPCLARTVLETIMSGLAGCFFWKRVFSALR